LRLFPASSREFPPSCPLFCRNPESILWDGAFILLREAVLVLRFVAYISTAIFPQGVVTFFYILPIQYALSRTWDLSSPPPRASFSVPILWTPREVPFFFCGSVHPLMTMVSTGSLLGEAFPGGRAPLYSQRPFFFFPFLSQVRFFPPHRIMSLSVRIQIDCAGVLSFLAQSKNLVILLNTLVSFLGFVRWLKITIFSRSVGSRLIPPPPM